MMTAILFQGTLFMKVGGSLGPHVIILDLSLGIARWFTGRVHKSCSTDTNIDPEIIVNAAAGTHKAGKYWQEIGVNIIVLLATGEPRANMSWWHLMKNWLVKKNRNSNSLLINKIKTQIVEKSKRIETRIVDLLKRIETRIVH